MSLEYYHEILKALSHPDPATCDGEKLLTMTKSCHDILRLLLQESMIKDIPDPAVNNGSKEDVLTTLISYSFNLSTAMSSSLSKYCIEKFKKSDPAFELPSSYDTEKSLILIQKVLEHFLELRMVCYSIFQEYLRIEQDDNHLFHNEVCKILLELKDSRNTKLLFDHVSALYRWRPKYVSPRKYLNYCGKNDNRDPGDCIATFSSEIVKLIADSVINELESVMDTLLLKFYNAQISTTISEIDSIIDLCGLLSKSLPKEAVGLLSKYSHEATKYIRNCTMRVQAKLVVLAAEVVQFWRLIPSSEDSSSTILKTSGHPLWETINMSILESIVKRLTNLIQVDVDSDKFKGVNLSGSVSLIFAIFSGRYLNILQLEKGDSFQDNGVTKSMAKLLYLSLDHGAVGNIYQYFSHLVSTDRSSVSQSTDSTNPDNLLRCTVIFEVVNMIISDITLSQPLTEIACVTELVTSILKAQPELSAVFWSSWRYCSKLMKTLKNFDDILEASMTFTTTESMEGDPHYMLRIKYPLTVLVLCLLRKAPHTPKYLITLLNALVYDETTAEYAIQILNEEVYVISDEVDAEKLSFWTPTVKISDQISSASSHDGMLYEFTDLETTVQTLTGSTRLSNSCIKLLIGMQVKYNSSELSNDSTPCLTRPVEGCVGYVYNVEFNEDLAQYYFTIRWDQKTIWWSIIMDILAYYLHVESQSSLIKSHSHSSEDFVAVMNFLSSLVKHNPLVASYFIKVKWDEWLLYSFLYELHMEALYPYLSHIDMTVASICNDPMKCRDIMLRNLKISSKYADGIIAHAKVMRIGEYKVADNPSIISIICFLLVRKIFGYAAVTGNSVDHHDKHIQATIDFSYSLSTCPAPWPQTFAENFARLSNKLLPKTISNHMRPYHAFFRGFQQRHQTSMSWNISSSFSKLLGSILISFSARVVTNSLKQLFDEIDENGDGRLSEEEIYQALTTLGHNLSMDAVKCLFQQLDVSKRGTVQYSDVLAYSASLQGKSLKASMHGQHDDVKLSGNEGYLTATDKAELSLQMLLVNLVSPQGFSSSEILLECAESILDFQIDTLLLFADTPKSYEKLTSFEPNECDWRNSVDLMRQILKNFKELLIYISKPSDTAISQPVATSTARSLLQKLLHQDTLLNIVLDCALCPAILWHLSNKPKARDVSMHDSNWQNILRSKDGHSSSLTDEKSVLSSVFDTENHSIESNNFSIVINLSLEGLCLLDQLMLYVFSQSPSSKEIAIYADHMKIAMQRSLVSRDIAIQNTDKTGRSGNYFIYLSGMLAVDKLKSSALIGADDMDNLYEVQIYSSILLSEVIILLNAKNRRLSNEETHYSAYQSQSSFLSTYLPLHELDSLARITCRLLVGASPSKVKLTIVNLLIVLVEEQPLLLSYLFCSQNSAAQVKPMVGSFLNDESATLKYLATISPSDSLLAWVIQTMISQVEYMYESHPLLLWRVLDLMKALMALGEYVPIRNIVFHLLQTPKFWDYVGFPIMQDLEPPPHCNNINDSSEENEKTSLSCTNYCYILQVHESSLAILSLERYGTFLSMDHSIGLQIAKKVDTLLQRANDKHRFLRWLKHYAVVSVDHELMVNLEKQVRRVGLTLHCFVSTLPQSSSTSSRFSSRSIIRKDEIDRNDSFPSYFLLMRMNYGINYIYDLFTAQNLLASVESFSQVDQDSSFSVTDWNSLENALKSVNLMWSVCDAQANLLSSWKLFLQVYVSPPSRKLRRTDMPSWNRGSIDRSQSVSSDEIAAIVATSGLRQYSDDLSGISSTPPDSPGVNLGLSPSIDGLLHSPSAQASSGFVGDRRSYEIISEIMSHLSVTNESANLLKSVYAVDISLGSVSMVSYDLNIALERAEVFVTMVHHQLRDIDVRTSDPTQASVDIRNTGSSRLSPAKRKSILEGLVKYYNHIYELLTDAGSSLKVSELFDLVKLRLLTSVLILVRSIDVADYSDDKQVEWYQLFQKIFFLASSTLCDNVRLHGRSSIIKAESQSKRTTSDPSRRNEVKGKRQSSKDFISMVCRDIDANKVRGHMDVVILVNNISLRIIKDSTPALFSFDGNMNLMFNEVIIPWQNMLKDKSSQLTHVLSHILTELSNATDIDIESHHRYDNSINVLPQWTNIVTNDSHGNSYDQKRVTSSMKKRLFTTYDQENDVDYLADDSLELALNDDAVVLPDVGLVNVLDVIFGLLSSYIVSPRQIIQLNILGTLTKSSIFHQYQAILSQQTSKQTTLPVLTTDKPSVTDLSSIGMYMGYSSITGTESKVYDAWIRVLQIVSAYIQALGIDSSSNHMPNSHMASEVSASLVPLSDFFHQYSTLMRIPLQSLENPATAKISLRQLNISASVLSTLAIVNNILPSLKPMIRDLWRNVTSSCYGIIQLLSHLLWEGEDNDEYQHQEYCLYITGAPISNYERKLAKISSPSTHKPSEGGSFLAASSIIRGSNSSNKPKSFQNLENKSKLDAKEIEANSVADRWNNSYFSKEYEKNLLNLFVQIVTWLQINTIPPIEMNHEDRHAMKMMKDSFSRYTHPHHFPSLHRPFPDLPIGSEVYYSKTTILGSLVSGNETTAIDSSLANPLNQSNASYNDAFDDESEKGFTHNDMILHGTVIKKSLISDSLTVDILLTDGTQHRHIAIDDIRSCNLPQILFHPSTDLSTTSYPWYHRYRHFAALIVKKNKDPENRSATRDFSAEGTASNDQFMSSGYTILPNASRGTTSTSLVRSGNTSRESKRISTSMLIKSLQYAVSNVTANRLNASSSPSISQDLFLLACRLSWLILQSCSHHARFIMNGKVYSWPIKFLVSQLEHIQSVVLGRGLHNDENKIISKNQQAPGLNSFILETPGLRSGMSISERQPEWTLREDWKDYVNWLLDVANRYIDELRDIDASPVRGGDPVYWKTPQKIMSPYADSQPKGIKKLGLRSAVPWISSPDVDM